MSNIITTPKGVIAIQASMPDDAALVRELRLEALANHPEAFAADYDSTAAESVELWAERIAKYALFRITRGRESPQSCQPELCFPDHP